MGHSGRTLRGGLKSNRLAGGILAVLGLTGLTAIDALSVGTRAIGGIQA
jgi:hypothetical protein